MILNIVLFLIKTVTSSSYPSYTYSKRKRRSITPINWKISVVRFRIGVRLIQWNSHRCRRSSRICVNILLLVFLVYFTTLKWNFPSDFEYKENARMIAFLAISKSNPRWSYTDWRINFSYSTIISYNRFIMVHCLPVVRSSMFPICSIKPNIWLPISKRNDHRIEFAS